MKEAVYGLSIGLAFMFVLILLIRFLTVILPPRVHLETKISSTCTIPATEWKCEINANTNEITCKGVMK